MSDDDQVIRRLEALGHSDQELPTAERLASIEATLVGRIGLVERSPEGEFSLRRAAPVLLAVAALLILFVFAAAWFGGDASLTVQAADGSVVIELPDGRSVNASVGLDLPDGSFVDVAEGASVKLGDDLLGPGRYFVRDGRATRTCQSSTHRAARPRPRYG